MTSGTETGRAAGVAVQRSAPLRDQVYQAIEDMIIAGELRSGARLIESEVATRLGVSRNPVREAMTALARAGWIEVRPRQGAFVRLQTAADAHDCFTVRCLLEVEAARQVAMRAEVDPTGTASGVASLRQLIARVQPLVRSGDQPGLVEANSEFHRKLVELSGSRLLMELLGQLDRRVRWYFGTVAVARASASWKEHEQILDAVEAGSTAIAAETMRLHIVSTSDAYLGRSDRAAESQGVT